MHKRASRQARRVVKLCCEFVRLYVLASTLTNHHHRRDRNDKTEFIEMSSLNFTEFLVAKAAHTASVCDSLGGSEFGDGKVFSGESQIFLIMMGIFIARELAHRPQQSRLIPVVFSLDLPSAVMQTGFAMLEVGGTGSTATISILFKNIIDCMVGSLAWLACGYAFAFGRSQGQFIGTEGFFLDKVGQCRYSHVFFQLAFATTAGTVVSGAMAGRVHVRPAHLSPCHPSEPLTYRVATLRIVAVGVHLPLDRNVVLGLSCGCSLGVGSGPVADKRGLPRLRGLSCRACCWWCLGVHWGVLGRTSRNGYV